MSRLFSTMKTKEALPIILDILRGGEASERDMDLAEKFINNVSSKINRLEGQVNELTSEKEALEAEVEKMKRSWKRV